jgi:hypothetical protein
MKPGSGGKVEPGMEFFVFRKGEEVKNPDSGLVLGSEESKIGKIKIVEDDLKGRQSEGFAGNRFQDG